MKPRTGYAGVMAIWLKTLWVVVLLGTIVVAVSLLLLWDFLVINLVRSGSVQSPARHSEGHPV
jgi:hypothetical protein